MPIISMGNRRHGAKPEEVSSAEVLSRYIIENPAVEEWLTSVTERTRLQYARILHDFHKWLTREGANGEFKGLTIRQLLEYQEKASGASRVTIANRLNIYISNQSAAKRPKSLKYVWTTVRSFFAYHGCDLPKRKFVLLDNHVEPAKQDLTYQHVVQILNAAKLRDKAIFTIMFQAGMGMREWQQFDRSWSQIKPQIEAGKDHLVINVTNRKGARGLSRGFKVVVGKDGTDLLKQYLKERGEPKEGEPIFLRDHPNYFETADESIKERSVRGSWERLARRIQLINYQGKGRTNRYGYSLHQLRDTFKTQWFTSSADKGVCDYLMGHVVDQNQYLKYGNVEEYVLRQYRLAEPKISPISNPNPDLVSMNKVENLQAELDKIKEEKAMQEESSKAERAEIMKDIADLKKLISKLNSQ